MANFTKICHCLKENAVLLMTVICIFVGVAVGIVLNMFHAAEIVKLYIALPGELFMRALYFSVLPLLSCNIIAMSARLKPSAHGRIAVMSLIYCMLFNNIGGFIAVGVTSLINPGKRFNASTGKSIGTNVSEKRMDISDVLPDFLRNMVPDNIIKTLLSSVVTTHVREPTFGAVDVNDTDVIYHRQVGSSNGPNILGVLTSSLVLGLVAGSRLEKTQPLIALAEAVTEVMTVLVGIIIQLLPLAMISLIASALATVDSLENGVIALSLLVACSLCFSLILSIVVFPLIHAMFVRRNLFAVYKAMYRPLITAFCTTSSLVTLPDLFKVCDQLGVEPYIVRTLAPFLTSFNANGSSAFIASAVCFIAQVTGFPLNVAQMIGIGFLAGFNVMALPAVPSASIITVFLIIRVFQIPEQAVSLLFIVEFINDRLRTVTNVMSHANCIMTVHYLTVRHRNSNKLDPIVVQFAFHKDLQGSTTMSQQVSGDSVTQNSLADSEEKIDQPFCVTIS